MDFKFRLEMKRDGSENGLRKEKNQISTWDRVLNEGIRLVMDARDSSGKDSEKCFGHIFKMQDDRWPKFILIRSYKEI